MVTFSWDNINLTQQNAILTTITSATATAILLTTIIPDQLQSYFSTKLNRITKSLSTQITIIIDEFNGLTPNSMFDAANVYLGSKYSMSTSRRIRASKSDKEKEVSFAVDRDEEVGDVFEGVKVVWVLNCGESKGSESGGKGGRKRESGVGLGGNGEVKYFELTFHKKYKEIVLTRYLRHILREAKNIKETKKEIKLHTVDYNGTDYWSSIVFDHPATFDKIAMDPDEKEELIEDLDRFINRKDYYRRVGKAWKRGYLLYGPPGTGKSSLVAAMANYLRFDVYDLDLKEVMCNSDLRRLLIGTASKSILVIEDIDCSIELQNREDGAPSTADDEKVSLSGLLNFIDGLWSTCGDERIIVFTTNDKNRLDPALLRPGRMDVHIHMSYCTFDGLKVLAANYLQLELEDQLIDEATLKQLISKVQVTPAEVAGELMKSDDPTVALQGLSLFLISKLGN